MLCRPLTREDALSASREKIRPNVEVQKTDIYGYVQIRCRHCADAACIKACIAGALYKDAEGYTIHDPEKCVGCWMCYVLPSWSDKAGQEK